MTVSYFVIQNIWTIQFRSSDISRFVSTLAHFVLKDWIYGRP